MFKNCKILKKYYKLAKIKWQLILLEFVILLIPSLLSILSPILTANVISSITVYDFKNAIYMLSLDFGIIVLTALLYFVYHFFRTKINKQILFNISETVYDYVRENKNLNKINSSTMTDIWSFSNFNSNLLYKVCFLIKAIIILFIISFYNFFIGLILILVSIISSLLLGFSNKQIQKHNLILTDNKIKALELFNSIQKGVSLDNNNYMENTMKYKYFDMMNDSVKTNTKISFFYNLNNNFISLILKIAVFLFTFYLITLIKSFHLTLSTYLVLTPYLTSSAQNLIAFFEIFPEIGLLDNTLSEFDKLKSQSNFESDKDNYTEILNNYKIQFFHADLKKDNYSISDANFEINKNEIVQIIGIENSGKRAVFELLTRREKINSGSIFLGTKNINDIPDWVFSKIIYTTGKEPYFYNISISENLQIVCDDKTKIIKLLKKFNIYSIINELEKGIDTIIDENISKKLLFFLGIIRCCFIDSKIFCIYEIPENFNISDFEVLSDIISYINKKSTIIIFTHKHLEKLSSSKNIFIENSKVKSIKENKISTD